MNNNTECSVVRDLLPMYDDSILSETSKQLVDEHLHSCTECREYHRRMLDKLEETDIEQKKMENRLVSSLKRRRYEIIGLISGIIFVFAVLVGLMLYINIKVKNTIIDHSESVLDYGKMRYSGISELVLFPDKKEVKGDIVDYYYDCEGSRLYQEYQIYMKCNYSKNDFEDECERLMKLQDSQTGKTTVYTTEENELPCVYAMLYDEGFEYALLDEEQGTIYYIYLQGIDRRDIYFDEELLPKDYGQKGLHVETERESYRIYEKAE